jgi:hypothetical protein
MADRGSNRGPSWRACPLKKTGCLPIWLKARAKNDGPDLFLHLAAEVVSLDRSGEFHRMLWRGERSGLTSSKDGPAV